MQTPSRHALVGALLALAFSAACGDSSAPSPRDQGAGAGLPTGGSSSGASSGAGTGSSGGQAPGGEADGGPGPVSAGSGSGSSPGADGGGPAGADAGPSTSGAGESGASPPPVAVDASSPASDAGPSLILDAEQVVVPGGTSYEAESPNNTLIGAARHRPCMACASTAAEMPQGPCCSGGQEVDNLLGHPANDLGALQWNGIAAPKDGLYNVDWWYFCGQADANGDMVCPWFGKMGLGNTPPGCRAAQFLVNGAPLHTEDVQFPCFSTPWSIVHLTTIAMPLKAGNSNTIRVYHVGTDAPDFDRIVVHDSTGPIGPLSAADAGSD
jgi:hypothetical protein